MLNQVGGETEQFLSFVPVSVSIADLNPTVTIQNFGIFSVCTPVLYAPPPPVTEHVSVNVKSKFEKMAGAIGGALNIHPLSWGGTNRKEPNSS